MKEKKGYLGTEPNSISFSFNCLMLGRNVGNYLRKNNISQVIVILDYKNNNIILKQNTSYGNSIAYPKYGGNDLIELKITNFLDLSKLVRSARNSYSCRAKPFSKDSVIIENVPLKRNPIASGKRIYIDLDRELIIFGRIFKNTELNLTLSEKDLVKQSNLQPTSLGATNSLTATPSVTQTRLTATPSQPESGKKDIVDKGIGNNDPLEMTAENSTPSDEQIIVDKEYSKMILGE